MRPPIRRRSAGALLPLLLLAACQRTADERVADGRRTETITVGDTVVVRNRGDDPLPRRLVVEQRIGELEGSEAYTFGTVDDVVPASDGGVYVWDGQSHEVRRYDADGRLVRQVGRRGAGPGEYELVIGMVTTEAGLAAWDPIHQRLSLFDAADAFVRSWNPPHPDPGMGSLHPDEEGGFWLRHTLVDPQTAGSGGVGYVRLRADGTPTADTVPAPPFPHAEFRLVARGPRLQVADRVPFTPSSLPALSPRGELATGSGERYAILLARPGAPPRRIERDVAAASVAEEERADAESRTTTMMRQADPRWSWNGPPIPTTRPFFRALKFGLDGRLWVERSLGGVRIPDDELEPPRPSPMRMRDAPPPPPLPPRRWRDSLAFDVFAPDGRYLGTVPKPRDAEFFTMRGDTIWGRLRDSLDVAYVARWRVEPALGRE